MTVAFAPIVVMAFGDRVPQVWRFMDEPAPIHRRIGDKSVVTPPGVGVASGESTTATGCRKRLRPSKQHGWTAIGPTDWIVSGNTARHLTRARRLVHAPLNAPDPQCQALRTQPGAPGCVRGNALRTDLRHLASHAHTMLCGGTYRGLSRVPRDAVVRGECLAQAGLPATYLLPGIPQPDRERGTIALGPINQGRCR